MKTGGQAEPRSSIRPMTFWCVRARRRTHPPAREPLRVGLVQERWHADAGEHRDLFGARSRSRRPRRAPRSSACRSSRCRRTSRSSDGGPGPQESTRGPARRADVRVRGRGRGRDRRVRARIALRAPMRSHRRSARVQHRDRRRPSGALVARTRKLHLPDHRGLLRGPVLPTRRHRLSGGRPRGRAVRLPDLLGPVVPGGGACLRTPGGRGAGVPHRDRIRARPSPRSTPNRCGSR